MFGPFRRKQLICICIIYRILLLNVSFHLVGSRGSFGKQTDVYSNTLAGPYANERRWCGDGGIKCTYVYYVYPSIAHTCACAPTNFSFMIFTSFFGKEKSLSTVVAAMHEWARLYAPFQRAQIIYLRLCTRVLYRTISGSVHL